MCAPLTALRSENMENFSAEGPGWQMLRVSGRQARGRVFHPCWQNMDEWGWESC
jgi:hypothetical protein